MDGNQKHLLRYIAIVSLFCIVCVIYLGRLFYMQISGRENTYESGTTTQTVTVQAVRGEIYDRNGIKLVENKYSYNMIITWNDFSSLNAEQKNSTILRLEKALRACDAQERYSRPYFPFDGQYPYYTYSEETLDPESAKSYRLTRVLTRLQLGKDATEEELADCYVKRYDLLRTDSNGTRIYNDNEIDLLIRFYYDMDAKAFYSNGEYVIVKDISPEVDTLMTYVQEQAIPGVSFQMGNFERVYLYPGVASHILGWVGPIYAEEWDYYNALGYQMSDLVGKSGCESAFEEYLHGTTGILEVTQDAAGNILSVTTIQEPVAGCDIRLTIDINLQIAAEEGLKSNVLSTAATADGDDCTAGAAVALDPETFEVLAIASYPTYDLTAINQNYNSLANDPAKPLDNRALQTTYAPGSTLKLGVGVIALMEGKVTANESIACTGIYRSTVACSTWGYESGLHNHSGSQNFFEAIAHSCNSYFCELGNRLGIQTMEEYLSRFGVGQATGLELGNAKGILAGPTYRAEIQGDAWSTGMTWMAAIGQVDNRMSPLQLATYTGTLVNGGTRYAATLLYGVYPFGSSEPVNSTEREILDSTEIPDDVRADLKIAMRQMINESGTTVQNSFRSLPDNVKVGGKTGTAQVGTGLADNALFVCEASTSEEGSDIVVSVVLEAGAHGYYATSTAGAILEAFYGVD